MVRSKLQITRRVLPQHHLARLTFRRDAVSLDDVPCKILLPEPLQTLCVDEGPEDRDAKPEEGGRKLGIIRHTGLLRLLEHTTVILVENQRRGEYTLVGGADAYLILRALRPQPAISVSALVLPPPSDARLILERAIYELVWPRFALLLVKLTHAESGRPGNLNRVLIHLLKEVEIDGRSLGDYLGLLASHIRGLTDLKGGALNYYDPASAGTKRVASSGGQASGPSPDLKEDETAVSRDMEEPASHSVEGAAPPADPVESAVTGQPASAPFPGPKEPAAVAAQDTEEPPSDGVEETAPPADPTGSAVTGQLSLFD